MRKKVMPAVMADEDDSKPTQRSRPDSHAQLQDSDFAVCVKRLGRLARSAAQALFTIAYLQRSPSVTAELVPEIYALAAILASFEDDLLLESAVRTEDPKDTWTWNHHKSLTRSMRECEHALVDISRAARTADEQFRASLNLKRGDDYIEHFHLDNGPQVLDTIVECFRLVTQTKVIVRHSALSRVESLDDNEMYETLRLTRALQHPDLEAIWTRKDVPFASKQMQLFSIPSYVPSAARIEPAEAEPSPASDTPDPAPKPEDTTPKDETPIWAYNQWPPFGNYQHPAYLAAMAKGRDKNNIPAEASSLPDYGSTSKSIPVSTPSTEPLPASYSASKVEPGKLKLGEVSFGEPSVINPISSGSLFSHILPSSPFANYSQPKANPVTPTPRLEAYILRPTVQTTESTSVLSYGDEPLRLGEEALQSQIRNLGPEYSVVDVLLDLHPQQLQLMQRRAAQRHGTIVSIHHGKPVSLDTVMGSLQGKPAVYIISTTTVLPQEGTEDPVSTVVTEKPANPTGTFGLGGSLFGTKPPFTTTFGTSNSDSSALVGSYLASPEVYSKYLQEKGEVCTYVEGTECKGRYQHYQTITMNKDWHDKDLSLEEIRLADYQAGRMGSDCQVKTNSTSYSADKLAGPTATSYLELAIPKTGWFATTIRPSAPGYAFVDNKSSAGAASIPGKMHEKLCTNVSLTKRQAVSSSESSPFGHIGSNLQPFVPSKATQPSVSDLDSTTTRQPLSESNPQMSQDAARVPKHAWPTESNTGCHPRFSPFVKAADPSDQTKWTMHPQDFCDIKHQHGKLCRALPAEASNKTGDSVTFPASEPLISSGVGKFAGTSSRSPFATLASGPPVLRHSSGPAPSQGSGNIPFEQALKNAIPPQLTSHLACNVFGCQICHLEPVSRYNKFDWSSAGPRPEPPSWSDQPKSVLFGSQITPKPGPFGAPNQAPPTSFGGSTSKLSDSSFVKGPTEQNPHSVSVIHATSNPSAQFSGGGLFGGGSNVTNPVPLPHVPQPVAASSGSGLFGATKPLPTSCVIGKPFGQASATEISPLSVPTAPNPYSSGLDQPVKATAVAPGTVWSGGGSGAPVVSKPSALQDYQRQMKELKERDTEMRRAGTVARRGPHDDVALAALLDSKNSAPRQDVLIASLTDARPEKAGAASPFDVSHATPLGSKESAIVDEEKHTSSSKERNEENMLSNVPSKNKYDEAEAVNPFEDVNAAEMTR